MVYRDLTENATVKLKEKFNVFNGVVCKDEIKNHKSTKCRGDPKIFKNKLIISKV